jgi:hypothetical protein
MAKLGAMADDKGVRHAVHQEEDTKEENVDRLRKLRRSLKEAAKGIAEDAAIKAVEPVTRPFVKKMKHFVDTRVSAQKDEDAAKQEAEKAHSEEQQNLKAALGALQAEKSAAEAAAQQAKFKLHMERQKLKKLQAEQVKTSVKDTQRQGMTHIKQVAESKVYKYAEEADAAKKDVAMAKDNLDHAKAVATQAATMKDKALGLTAARNKLRMKGTQAQMKDVDQVVPETAKTNSAEMEMPQDTDTSGEQKNGALQMTVVSVVAAAALAAVLGEVCRPL